ncbi:hypothetical protein WKI13_10430 [Teredinibacter turnerae]|uniref:hypothetical protein n=2 Tax=Teredinibacter turnerae TaxID=2426 RepID=UPI0003724638|nr:hypothetical protein [Teredinibacter turnerae]
MPSLPRQRFQTPADELCKPDFAELAWHFEDGFMNTLLKAGATPPNSKEIKSNCVNTAVKLQQTKKGNMVFLQLFCKLMLSYSQKMQPFLTETTMLFLKSTNVTIAFNSEAKRELAEYFSMVGINLDSIKTHDDYLRTRKKASPYFMEWLSLKAERWPENNGQYQLLKKALFD